MESKRIKRLKQKSDSASEKKVALSQNPGFKRILLKFLVVGDFGVGKTAIVRRYIEGKFSSSYKVTVGADFSTKTFLRDGNTRVSVQLWDIAGQEKYCYMTRAFYKYAVAAAVVFDLTRLATFYAASKWLEDLREKVTLKDGSAIPVVLLATKCDIKENHINASVINKFCKDNSISAWFATSSKDNINIGEAVSFLVEKCINVTPKELNTESVIINENNHCEKMKSQSKKLFCCPIS